MVAMPKPTEPAFILDVSRAISADLPAWPGDPLVQVTPLSVADGTGPAVSHLSLSSHSGTHVDAPAHYLAGGVTVDRLPLDVLIGAAWLAHVPGGGHVTAAKLAGAAIPAGITRLLIRTENSERVAVGGRFEPGFLALTADAAAWLLDKGMRLVGIDGPSVEPFDAEGAPVHRALLEAGVVIVEGLDLAGIPAGPYRLICLPLRVAGADGAPARAVLLPEAQASSTKEIA